MACLPFALAAVLSLFLAPFAHVDADAGSNYLVSGETVPGGGNLTYRNFVLEIQSDCNLVLYSGDWQSNTANRAKNCYLTMLSSGLLMVRSSRYAIWNSAIDSIAPSGEYVAIIHPQGKIATFGDRVWAARPSAVGSGNDLTGDSPRRLGGTVDSPGYAPNLLFTGQVLLCGDNLAAGNHTLLMRGDCNLVLDGGKWQSNTAGKGRGCSLHLDDRGKLSIYDYQNKEVWNTGGRPHYPWSSTYVLLLRNDGIAGIYGPMRWSNKRISLAAASEEIATVTDE